MEFTKQDRKFMELALILARKGKNRVFPNPMVGCVIAKNGKVVGRGWHEYFGGPHAEINALKSAGPAAEGANMYVTLEPCCHYGKTPPCTDSIVKAGIARIFSAMTDPNPKVCGHGLNKLSEKSIKTYCGLLGKKAKSMNSEYLKTIKKRKSRVIIKAAMTMDGKIASFTGNSKWITSPESRGVAHSIRSDVDAVLIGIGTALKDNPRLTSHGKGRNPVRVVLDPHLSIPIYSNVLDKSAPTVVFHGKDILKVRHEALKKKGIFTREVASKRGVLNFKQIINELNKMSLFSILIEGGGETIANALNSKIADEVIFFIAPKLLGGRKAKTPVEGLGISKIAGAVSVAKWKIRRVGPDIMISGRLK